MIRAEIDRRYGGRNCDGSCDSLDPISVVSAITIMTESTELVVAKVNLHKSQ